MTNAAGGTTGNGGINALPAVAFLVTIGLAIIVGMGWI